MSARLVQTFSVAVKVVGAPHALNGKLVEVEHGRPAVQVYM